MNSVGDLAFAAVGGVIGAALLYYSSRATPAAKSKYLARGAGVALVAMSLLLLFMVFVNTRP